MIDLIIGFVVGVVVMAGVAWYWIRRYGAKIEQKVRDTYAELSDSAKKSSKGFMDKLLENFKK